MSLAAPTRTLEGLPELRQQIAFLYASPNSGHKICAGAVRKVFDSCYPSTLHTVELDTITYLYPILGSLVAKTYLEILRYTPQLWDFLYDNPEVEELTREIRQLFNIFNAQKLKFLIEQYQPTAFVCTHAVPCGVIAEYKRRGETKMPLVGILTDYAVHSYWIYPEVDLYIVANQSSEETLLRKGIRKEKIKICGIPIDPAFGNKLTKEKARKKLGLDPMKKTLLLMGGTHGWGPLQDTLDEILSLRLPIQILIVTGLNKELKSNLQRKQKSRSVQIYGYTRTIPLLMDASDILVTKPGGITTSESLAKGLPMVLVNPIPGQEERNAEHLVKNGAAVKTKNMDHFKDTLKQLLADSDKLETLAEKCQKIATPTAAWDSVHAIARLLSESQDGHRLPAQTVARAS
ncbi:MAG: glycosyltransferase [Elusimicrobia bacterium]|nr:glycosyltransferase [Elusimicrobiota bacterium]MBI4217689.1 glycosyltransferase [Elusimicrobiota bacterium]